MIARSRLRGGNMQFAWPPWEGSCFLKAVTPEVRLVSTFVAGARLEVGGGQKSAGVYGTRDQWGHWPAVGKPAGLACVALPHGRPRSSFVIDGEGIRGRKG